MRGHFLIGVMFLLLVGCQEKVDPVEVTSLSGNVFGSTYSIKYVGDLKKDVWQKEVDVFFKEFNDEFSTYQNDSVINQFNNLGVQKKLTVSPRFIAMLELAQSLSDKTSGAFDPTLGPVIEAWNSKDGLQTPSEEVILKSLSQMGLKNIKWENGQVWKTVPGLKLNLNAFAPGWVADLLGADLVKKGISNFMIDIGGEILVKGKKAEGSPWVIGIEEPSDSPGHLIRTALKITDASISTSGSYRQFLVDNGKRRSHIIDPRTGRPVSHEISSVTVIAPSAAEADGWGTALMVLGEEGIPLAEKQGIKVLMLKGSQSKLSQVVSFEMKSFMKTNQLQGN